MAFNSVFGAIAYISLYRFMMSCFCVPHGFLNFIVCEFYVYLLLLCCVTHCADFHVFFYCCFSPTITCCQCLVFIFIYLLYFCVVPYSDSISGEYFCDSIRFLRLFDFPERCCIIYFPILVPVEGFHSDFFFFHFILIVVFDIFSGFIDQ